MLGVIKTALQATNNKERADAEQWLVQARLQNPNWFFSELCLIANDQNSDRLIRKSVFTLVSTSVLTKITQPNMPQSVFWEALSQEVRDSVKTTALSALIAEEKEIRRAAADLTSAICFHEVPRKAWPDVIERMCGNICSTNNIVKDASVVFVGFLCERISSRKAEFQLNATDQSTILSSLLLAIRDPLLIGTALKALVDSISSLQECFRKPEFCNYLFNEMAPLLGAGNEHTKTAIQVIGEFAKSNYLLIEPYLNGIFTVLGPYILKSSDDDELTIASIEFWETLADSYQELKRKPENQNYANYFATNFGIEVIKVLIMKLQSIPVRNNLDDDEDEVYSSAVKCLSTICESSAFYLREFLCQFIENNIAHEDSRNKRACASVFGALVGGLDLSVAQPLVQSSLTAILKLLVDPSQTVQVQTLNAFSIISEQNPECLLNFQPFVVVMEHLAIMIQPAHSKKTIVACSIFISLIKRNQELKLKNFEPFVDKLAELLVMKGFHSEASDHVVTHIVLTLVELIFCEGYPAFCLKFIESSIIELASLPKYKPGQQALFVESFFTIIQFCLTRLFQFKDTTVLSGELFKQIYNAITGQFNRVKKVTSAPMFTACSLFYFNNGRQECLHDFMLYLKPVFLQPNEAELYNAGINTLVPIINTFREHSLSLIAMLHPNFIAAFNNPQVHRLCKMEIISLYGQLALICGSHFGNLEAEILAMIGTVCDASIALTQTCQEDFELLNERLVETLTSLVTGLNTSRSASSVIPYLPKIIQFVLLSCQKKYRPKINFVKNCVLLLSDLANYYKNHAMVYLRNLEVKNCIETLVKYNQGGEMNYALKYAKRCLQ